MELKRAKEIIDSPKTIDVTFQGNPVWIEELNFEQQTAVISSGMFEGGHQTVPVNQLQEANFHDDNPQT